MMYNRDVHQLIQLFISSAHKKEALAELCRRRSSFPNFAKTLWDSCGVITALIQEVILIYPALSPPKLTVEASNRVCNALALFQCVASHPDTQHLLLQAHVPLFIYPFLNTKAKARPFEYLRLTSLGVLGALIQHGDPDVVNFFLQTELIPLCLRIMEDSSKLSKTVATFIVLKILLNEVGLDYVCATAERFYAVSTVLSNLVKYEESMIGDPQNSSPRIIRYLIRSYLRLSQNTRAREALYQCMPEMLYPHNALLSVLDKDDLAHVWLKQLLMNLEFANI